MMTKQERIFATLAGEQTDRVPFSVYVHSTVHERSVEKFTEFTLGFYKTYDPDYVKVMFDDHYDLPSVYDFVRSVDVWRELEEFDPHLGAFGRVLESLKRIKQAVGHDVPVIQTVYLPFHFGMRLAHRRILEDLNADPAAVSAGLAMIAKNTISFARACLAEAGIDGFFFGAYGCESSWMTQDQYRQAVMPHDLAVISAVKESPVTILHIHGEKDSYFKLLADYPVAALSWEDRAAGPSLSQARQITSKCLVGGIDHLSAQHVTPAGIVSQARQAIGETKGRGLILAPGCTFLPGTPAKNMHALKLAVSGRG